MEANGGASLFTNNGLKFYHRHCFMQYKTDIWFNLSTYSLFRLEILTSIFII